MKAKTVALLGLAAAAPVAASFALTEYVMRVALDREVPRSFERMLELLAGNKHGDDPYEIFTPDSEALRARPHERIEVLAPDGTKLVGHWFEQKNAKRVILAAHGWRSEWHRDFCLSSLFYAANECSALYIEQRWQGESGGDHLGFGLLEHQDLPIWLRWIKERCGEAPVYLAGISMGASTVLMAADLDLPGNVRGIMADCGFTSPEAIWRFVTRHNLHLPYLLTGLAARILCKKRIGLAPDAKSTVDALAHSRYPILLIHGLDDGFVPPSMTQENYTACSAPKRMLLVPGAIHGMSYVVMRDEYEAMIKQFWADFDT